ncbi:hypothetical protein BT96DRAFT_418324 [Gymnopus androsaceus JB14]|uniref:Uncharacterized protein n=1 Tax=Gymnopus androsaceus JB14 TaxID=1447944 RepID=A0A6A4I3D4_9AGAR|nr:hypothetical protein BT96DRAFT_418324 [Gymnopus androsaceus JB14]
MSFRKFTESLIFKWSEFISFLLFSVILRKSIFQIVTKIIYLPHASVRLKHNYWQCA